MILVNYTKREYVDESLILIKEDAPRVLPILGKTRWAGDVCGAVGGSFTKEVAEVKAKYKSVVLEAIQAYNDYTAAKLNKRSYNGLAFINRPYKGS